MTTSELLVVIDKLKGPIIFRLVLCARLSAPSSFSQKDNQIQGVFIYNRPVNLHHFFVFIGNLYDYEGTYMHTPSM